MQPPLPVLFLNSTVIAVVVTHHEPRPGQHRRLRLRAAALPGRELLFLVVLATLMIPDQLRLVPVYLLMNAVGLTRGLGQYVAVMIVLAISGTSIFLMRQFFISMPTRAGGGGAHRRRGLLHHVQQGHAAAGRSGHRGRDDPARSRGPGTGSSGRSCSWPPGPLHAADRALLLPHRRRASRTTGRR